MTPEIASQLADHQARISACEAADTRVEERLDKLIFLVISTLIASIGALVVGILKH